MLHLAGAIISGILSKVGNIKPKLGVQVKHKHQYCSNKISTWLQQYTALPLVGHPTIVLLPSLYSCVSVVLPLYKTSQHVFGQAKVTPDQSHCKGTPDLESELNRPAAQ